MGGHDKKGALGTNLQPTGSGVYAMSENHK